MPFSRCKHETEPGCAGLSRKILGTIEQERYESFQKLQSETRIQITKSTPNTKRMKKEIGKKITKQLRGKRRNHDEQ